MGAAGRPPAATGDATSAASAARRGNAASTNDEGSAKSAATAAKGVPSVADATNRGLPRRRGVAACRLPSAMDTGGARRSSARVVLATMPVDGHPDSPPGAAFAAAAAATDEAPAAAVALTTTTTPTAATATATAAAAAATRGGEAARLADTFMAAAACVDAATRRATPPTNNNVNTRATGGPCSAPAADDDDRDDKAVEQGWRLSLPRAETKKNGEQDDRRGMLACHVSRRRCRWRRHEGVLYQLSATAVVGGGGRSREGRGGEPLSPWTLPGRHEATAAAAEASCLGT